jgi:hypothetical protein
VFLTNEFVKICNYNLILVFAREEEDGWPERGTAGGAGAAPNG